ncbi:hypothetical protein [Sphingobacterium faecium]|uniref:hypothetical protein n=1 Tax=Sphingobacterium faecium TaxID=34087 RepID=UPI0024690678|nr:hypothetical protein [Sphingobacterium faecium]MDH5828835.1 hypothetical protein [Sphingobacterium faecium]WGQ17032.1 hypothetical protein QG727_22925 [Sphingobacterium faecium]
MISIENRLYLSKPLLNEMAGNSSVQELTENKATKIFTIKNRMYVVVAFCSSGAKGIHWVNVQECIPFHQFKGTTHVYNERYDLARKGVKERGDYHGQLFSYKNKPYVFIGKMETVYPIQQAEQLDLFN